jgi:serine/threonine-protein kinase
MFALLAVVLPVNLLFLLPFLGGDARARELFGATLLLAVVGSAWLFWSLRKDRYDVSRLMLVGALWLAAGLAGIRYFGVFSPVVVVLPLGVFFFGLTRDARAQAAGYAVVALSYFFMAVITLRRHAGDPGIVAASLTPPQSMVMIAVTEIVLLVTFVNARAAREATLLALARHDRAAWTVVQKDALLLERSVDLARALDVAGVGRFSDTVVGKYRLGMVIGRGAMGEVYEARHEETHEEVAVKLLHTHTLREPGSVQRFLREAKMASALETEHVVRIVEIGGFDGDLPYLAMERLRGDDLAEILRREGRLPLPGILRLLAEVGAALSEARRAGIVHRDVKPRNLFLSTREGMSTPPPSGATTTWKLLDFGVSRFATPDVTHTDGRIVGTPEYMAPEQAAGEIVTHRTDLFSLGAVVYRALTGGPAFAGDHIAEVLYQVAQTMPPRPSALADLRPEVDLVMALALAKSPLDRFDSAEELRGALLAAASGEIAPDLAARARRLLSVSPWEEAVKDDPT